MDEKKGWLFHPLKVFISTVHLGILRTIHDCKEIAVLDTQ
jgi:hypothetical protein